MTDGANIIAAARRWIGTPWRHQGRSASGVDCVGLLVMIARELGLSVKDETGYRRRQDGRRLFDILSRELQLSAITNWKNGDIGLFKECGFPVHVGFLAREDTTETVIHAHARRRQVVEEPLAVYGAPVAVFSLKEQD